MPLDTPLSTEIWSEYELTRGKDATRAFHVTGVTTSAQAEATAGVAVGNLHPEDARLRIPLGGIRVDKSKGPLGRKVTARYENLAGGGGGPDPVDEIPIIFPQLQDQSEPIDRDWAGVPITNSARIPFGSQVTRAFSTLQITLTRNESSFQVSRALSFCNTFNDNSVTIARVGTLLKYQLLCKHIQVAAGFPLDAAYVKVVYTFEARDYLRKADGSVLTDGNNEPMSGWAKRILSQGREGLYDGGTKTGNIVKISDGRPVTKDVPLNGFGRPADDNLYAVFSKNAPNGGKPMPPSVAVEKAPDNDGVIGGTFLIFDVYTSISFNGLNLPAS